MNESVLLAWLQTYGEGVIAVAAMVTALLLAKSIKDFSHSGPQIRGVIGKHYRLYLAYAMARLAGWCFVLSTALAAAGVLVIASISILVGAGPSFWWAVGAGILSLGVLFIQQFVRTLLFSPAVIAASSPYRMSRFYPLWRYLTAARVTFVRRLLWVSAGVTWVTGCGVAVERGHWTVLLVLAASGLVLLTLYVWSTWPLRPKAQPARQNDSSRPNIVMIGCDTLRSDRIGANGYPRPLTPFIDSLAQRGALFRNCYVPIARTAPSLMSFLTGVWPQTHGVRDNFVCASDVSASVKFLPQMLAQNGYETAAVSDWAGGDFAKFGFGFKHIDGPDDQWNIKYLIRQGPKDVRLFLSLFMQNRLGKHFLPEVYYLAGIPLTEELGTQAMRIINERGQESKPFFLNLFMATAHPPFGSEYPYYLKYSDRDYSGESKFAMSRLTDPFEIIRSQREPKEAFDLDQIINLYDGCVSRFDDEVKRVVSHLEQSGLADNTVVVVYSDHGMEFFEHGTWGQGNSALGDFSARVPLLIVDPRRKGIGRIDHLVRSVDLAPTLLELVGLKTPSDVDGKSLLEIIDDPASDPARVAYFETGIWLTVPPGTNPDHLVYPDILELLDVEDIAAGTLTVKKAFRKRVVEARDRMVRRGPWVLVYMPMQRGPVYRLFDVEQDPLCTCDLSASHPEIAAALKECLRTWLEPDQCSVDDNARIDGTHASL